MGKSVWVTTRARDGSRLAMKVDVAPGRSPVRLWTWAVVSHNGAHPYLHVQPQSTRVQATEFAAELNSALTKRAYFARRVVYELHLPRDGRATPGLPICRRASALGKL